MKKLLQFTLGICLFAVVVLPAKAGFSSMYVFGDALSATEDTGPNGSPGPPNYYGYRDSNGRVWVEVLAQRQGIPINYNNSYFDHNSSDTLTDVSSFTAPPDVANDLFIVWVCNADTYDAAIFPDDSAGWIADNNASQTRHLQIITTLYAKGVRTLIMPNAVDISLIPEFNTYSSTNVNHAGCVDFNTKFANTLNQARAMCPGLKIYAPDFFTLLNNVLANPAYYGLNNALYNGYSIDALDDPAIHSIVSTNGAGTNYVFWDADDPTAQFHAVIADITQQFISPVSISKMTLFLSSNFTGSNRLDVVNMPVGLSGFVDGGTNLVRSTWNTKTSFDSTSPSQSIFVPVVNPASQRYYRLRFPYAWSWP